MATALSTFCVIFGYLVGSFCSAIIVSRVFDLPDPRREGSLNPGATNVLRLAGKKYAVIVLLVDVLKGVLPVLLAKVLTGNTIIISFTGLAAVLGHMYPIFFKLRGGKGVATAIGVLLGLHFLLGTFVIATWLLISYLTRYSSLSSLTALIFAPFYSLFFFGNIQAFMPLMLIAFLVVYKHRHNINRLIDGTEPKILFNKKRAESPQGPIETIETLMTEPEEKDDSTN